jgi:hypothetical protein
MAWSLNTFFDQQTSQEIGTQSILLAFWICIWDCVSRGSFSCFASMCQDFFDNGAFCLRERLCCIAEEYGILISSLFGFD